MKGIEGLLEEVLLEVVNAYPDGDGDGDSPAGYPDGDGDGDNLLEAYPDGDGDGDQLVEGAGGGDGDGDGKVSAVGARSKKNKDPDIKKIDKDVLKYDKKMSTDTSKKKKKKKKSEEVNDTDIETVDEDNDGGYEGKGKGPMGKGKGKGKTNVKKKCKKTGKETVVKSFDQLGEAQNFVRRSRVEGFDYFIEASIEIKDKNAQNITVDGKPYTKGFGSLKADYPKHFAALRAKLKADGKTMGNFGGNDSAVDINAKADGSIVVNYDA